MSDTAKVRAIREYITKVDKGDIPGANIFVAQNFSYNHTASGGAAAYSAGKTLTKDQVNEVQAALQNNFKAIKTEIESITENGGKVQVRAKTTFELKVKEVPFTAEYEFDGDKISAVHVTSESGIVPV